LREPCRGKEYVGKTTHIRHRGGVVHFEGQVPATAEASAITRDMLDGWLPAAVGDDAGDSVRLGASELATNAVRHGVLPADSSVRLLVDVEEGNVHVAVEQTSSTGGARLVAPEDRGDGGFGLAIVDSVADRWGIEAGPPGRVWFDVAIAAATLGPVLRTVAE
jgi:anti-sigma regulatory factor (Ser/Thr protein kinase)